MNTQLTLSNDGSFLAELKAKPIFLQQICEAQNVIVICKLKENNAILIESDDCLMFRDRIFVPKNSELIKKILHKAHSGCLSVHPGSIKMYNALKQLYWWSDMKRNTSEFVARCLVCQQIKAKHQVPSGLLQPVMIPEWRWDRVTLDFVSGLPFSSKKKDINEINTLHPVHTDYSLDRLVELYIAGIVRLYGVPVLIISDRDLRFTLRFWKKLQEEHEVEF
ncbi:Retrotransposable element Tf2 [Gossypium australe]|uniref:Retrotransposable element Tf2 n=1 Tax=Gossypium australe TaxID=47621 RepID=A0A5B6UYZ0_9ROSI|nr:Retrotransposable element Tf2 [Gossypium australe]